MTTHTADRPPHSGPFKTRTGVVIGGAYIPPRTPAYADPVERVSQRMPLHEKALYVVGAASFIFVGLLIYWGK